MARVRVVVRHAGKLPFFHPADRSGVPSSIPLSRLVVTLAVMPQHAHEDYRPARLDEPWTPDVILDTGAPLTLFPYSVWQPFVSAVTWLDQPAAPVGTTRRVTVLGGSWAYRLGRVRVGLTDPGGGWLPAVWTNAWFLDDHPAAPKQAVLGLRSGLFDNRQLRQERAADEWWLEDA